MRRVIAFAVLLPVLFFSEGVSTGEEYRLSMLPRYAPDEINRRITPLARYISRKIGVSVEPVIASDFAQYEKRLKNGSIEIGYENPYIYVLVSGAHEVLAMARKGRDKERFRGIIIVRNDSDISSLNDLKNRKISIVGYTSAGGYLSQKLTLIRKGMDMKRDFRIAEAVGNKQENVILSVYMGEADAGFIRESALHRADEFVPPSRIRVINRSAWLPNWALSVSRSIPDGKKRTIQKALLELKENDPVLKALKINGLRMAADEEYDPVRQAAGMKIPGR